MALSALLLCAFLAAPSRAEEPLWADGPGTENPQSCDWGADRDKKLARIFREVQRAALDLYKNERYTNAGKKFEAYNKNFELKYTDRVETVAGGSPAAALPPLNGRPPYIAAGYGLFSAVCGEDQVAFVLAHEATHLVRRHPDRLGAEIVQLFNAYYASLSPARRAGKTGAQILAGFRRENRSLLDSMQRHYEDEADDGGMKVLVHSGKFDRKTAARAAARLKDWVWVSQVRLAMTHAALEKRAARLQKIADQLR